MKITVAKSAGFCPGVKRAIKKALDAASSGKRVEMLGDIVHNEIVVEKIRQAGIKKVKKLTSGNNKILLIRAHGAPESTIDNAARLGYTVIDATCPMVKDIHQKAKTLFRKGRTILVIGDRQHDEVQGIVGHVPSPVLVIENPGDIPLEDIIKIKRAAVVVQSTQSQENVLAVLGILKSHIDDLHFCDTICRATRLRQQELQTLPYENDVVLVIGSKTSANTKRLYEISLARNPGTYWILSAGEIDPAWFNAASSVGITAGASTPDESIHEVVAYVKGLAGAPDGR